MIPRALWLANRRYFQRHRWLLLMMWLGVALGTGVVAAVELTTRSADANFRLSMERLYGSATHRISAASALNEQLLSQLQQRFGVTAVPVLQRYLRTAGSEPHLLQLLALDLISGTSLQPLAQSGEADAQLPSQWLLQPGVMVGAPTLSALGLTVGDQLLVDTPDGEQALPIIASLGQPNDRRYTRLVVMDIGKAQQVLHLNGQLDWIDLKLSQEQAIAIEGWLPAAAQLYRLDRDDSESLAQALYTNLRALSMLALVVGLFLVYNSLQFSLVQRQSLLARLRTLGVSVAELRRYLALELLVVGVAGSLTGLAIGSLLASHLLLLVTATVNNLYATSPIDSLNLSSSAVAYSLGVGLAGTLLAGWLPVRSATRQSPVDAGRRATQDRHSQQLARGQFMTGWLLLLPLWGLWQWSGSGLVGGLLGMTLLLVAVALMMPLSTCWFAQRCAGWLAHRPTTLLLRMALGGIARGLSRTGVALMALTLAVAATVGISILVGSFRGTLEGWLEHRLNADLYLSPLSSMPADQRPLDPQVWPLLAAQPEVAAIARYQRQEIRLQDGQRIELFAATLPAQARAGYRFVDRDAAAVWQEFDRADRVLISEPLANRLGLTAGDSIVLPGPQSDRPQTVAGVYYDYGYPQGRVLMSDRHYRQGWGEPAPRVAAIYLHPDQSLDRLVRRLSTWPQATQWQFREAQGVIERSLQIFAQTFRITELLKLLAVGVAFIGIVASLMALQLERRHELRLYRALGMSLLEQRTLLLWQALFMGAAAGFMAMPAGLLLGWALADLVQLRAFGWSLFYQFPGWSLLQAPLLAVLAALLSVAYPAWQLGQPEMTAR